MTISAFLTTVWLWLLLVGQPIIIVSLHDQAAAPISGATVSLLQNGQVIVSAVTDADGRATITIPTSVATLLLVRVQGRANDGSSISTENDGIQVFLQGNETLVPLRADVGGVIIPDPFSLREIGTELDGTVLPVVSSVATSIVEAAPVLTTTRASSSDLSAAPPRINIMYRLVLLALGIACVSVVLVIALQRRYHQ